MAYFIDKAEALLGAGAPTCADGHVAKNFFAVPLEVRRARAVRRGVDPVVVGHDGCDFVSFSAGAAGLRRDGLIFVKENNAKDGFVLDTEDSSLTRSHKYFCTCSRRGWAGSVKHRTQKDFRELFKVRCCEASNAA